MGYMHPPHNVNCSIMAEMLPLLDVHPVIFTRSESSLHISFDLLLCWITVVLEQDDTHAPFPKKSTGAHLDGSIALLLEEETPFASSKPLNRPL